MSYNNINMEVGYAPMQGHNELIRVIRDCNSNCKVFYYNPPGRPILEKGLINYCKSNEIAFINLNNRAIDDFIEGLAREVNNNNSLLIIGGGFSEQCLNNALKVKLHESKSNEKPFINKSNIIYTSINVDEVIDELNKHLENKIVLTH